MSFDELMHEVNEDLRKENLQKFWQKYGNMIIGGAALIVASTALYSGFKTYQRQNREADAFTLTMATAQIQDGKTNEALLTLDQLASEGRASIPAFAQFQKAALLAKSGKKQEAIDLYNNLAEDKDLSEGLKASAVLAKASLMVDLKTVSEVETALKPLLENTLYAEFAKELQGLALLKAGQKNDAKKLFEGILANDKAPSGLRARVAILLQASES